MKYSLFLFLIILIFTSCSDYKFSKLIITTDNENKNSGNLPLSELTIYKNGKFFKKIVGKESIFIDNPITIDSLEKGEYEFEYYNLFGEKVKKKYVAKNKKKIDSLQIHPDQFDSTNKLNRSIINRLRNDSVKINYLSNGCFQKISDSIIIRNKNGNYFISHGNKTRQLNEREIKKLIQFECELYSIPQDGGCTTIEIYRISSNNKKDSIRNGGCIWSGWENINNILETKK